MPSVDASTPRHAHTAAGATIQVPYVYAEGHVMTAPEILWLNSQLAGVLANALAGDVRRAKDAGKPIDPSEYQSRFDAKFAAYELGESNRGGGAGSSHDPIAEAAQRIATVKVKELAVAKGHKIRDLYAAKDADGVSKMAQLVSAYIARNDWVMDQARAQVEALAAAGVGVDDGLDFGPTPAPSAEPEVEAPRQKRA